MRKLVLIFILVYYSLGTMLLPMGDLACLKDFSGMYHHCASEDPDITPCEFVFEHLLNVEDPLDQFETDNDHSVRHEKPHQWFFGHDITQMLVVCSASLSLPPRDRIAFDGLPEYRARSVCYTPHQLFSDVFRPLILSLSCEV